MAFSFTKTRANITSHPKVAIDQHATNSDSSTNGNRNNNNNNNNNNSISSSPNKLTTTTTNSTQLNKSAKLLYPTWLKDSPSCLKQLPGIYHGVLGQVQLQPMLSLGDKNNKFSTGLDKLVKQHQKTDYFNRLTDTERVRQLLSTSRLSDDHLAAIWAHVNKTLPGQLTNREVCFALALIAIFQRLDKDGLLANDNDHKDSSGNGAFDGDAGNRPSKPQNSKEHDPFSLVKLEKKPPVPILYPLVNDGARGLKSSSSSLNTQRLPSSNSVPNDLGALLIDITGDDPGDLPSSNVTSSGVQKSASHQAANLLGGDSMSLLDDDPQSFLVVDLPKLHNVWFKCMSSMKALFKRSFDILNVENSRSSALEALRTDEGYAFCKNLCLCYPIAHNIAFKVDELRQFQDEKLSGGGGGSDGSGGRQQLRFMDKNYATLINDLMISINEYWAVLINLFHESGLTNFIELIMDGLNRDNKTLTSDTLQGIIQELDTMNKSDLCSLCHTRFYLVNLGDALNMRDIDQHDLELVLSNELLTNDSQTSQQDNNDADDDLSEQCYFYHVKCANFWLNNVTDNDQGQLPFRCSSVRLNQSNILKPTTINRTKEVH